MTNNVKFTLEFMTTWARQIELVTLNIICSIVKRHGYLNNLNNTSRACLLLCPMFIISTQVCANQVASLPLQSTLGQKPITKTYNVIYQSIWQPQNEKEKRRKEEKILYSCSCSNKSILMWNVDKLVWGNAIAHINVPNLVMYYAKSPKNSVRLCWFN